METLVILDYSIGGVFIYDLEESEDVLSVLKKHNHKESECAWMYTSNFILHDERKKQINISKLKVNYGNNQL